MAFFPLSSRSRPRLLHWVRGFFRGVLQKARPHSPLRRRRVVFFPMPGGRTLRRGLASARDFTVELVRNPRSVGAICPSSPHLAAGMASLIPDGRGLVVEIGAGTGAVTRAILNRGIPPTRLVIIERSPVFCRILREKFPGLRVIQGDAAHLCRLLPAGTMVDAVVSSLPLMSLPAATRSAILEQISRIISPHGCVIQFTYALWRPSPFHHEGCLRDQRALIIRNMPPARLERFRRHPAK